MAKSLSVINETSTGRNQTFRDNYKNTNMSRQKFVKDVAAGDKLPNG